MPVKRRVLILDDHPVVREGLARLIAHEPDLMVCAQCSEGPEALAQLGPARPDVAVVDISLPGINGLEVIKTLLARRPGLPILVVSLHDENVYAERALRAGARGYVMKRESADRVVEALRKVLEGKIYLSAAVSEKILARLAEVPKSGGSPLDQLSDRELEVFELIGHGFKPRQMAERLHLSVKTVAFYRDHIKEKLCLSSAAELTTFAVEWAGTEGSGVSVSKKLPPKRKR